MQGLKNSPEAFTHSNKVLRNKVLGHDLDFCKPLKSEHFSPAIDPT